VAEYEKVKAKFITLDPEHRWGWNVQRCGYAIFEREDLPDGRIRFGLGDGSDMIVQPNDYVRANRHVRGYWNDRDVWVTYDAPPIR
jgi:hypothetical protein